MKNLFTSYFVFISYFVFSQCEVPIVTNWFAENDSTFIIDFIASESSSDYVITFVGMYQDNGLEVTSEDFLYFTEGTYSDWVTSGLNTVSLDPRVADFNIFTPAPNYYYKVKIGTLCANDTVWGSDFYMSENSLLNDSGFSCEYFNMPFTFLPDLESGGTPFAINTDFEVADFVGEIENMSILIDIGHSFLGDLSIDLTSPSGTTISLMPQSAALNSTDGFSVLFQNGAPNISTNPSELGFVRGIYSPAETFDAFVGESPNGLWTIHITDNISGDFGFLFGACLNFNHSPCVASLAGNAFYDLNNNGVNDMGDQPFSYGIVGSNEGTIMIGNEQGDYFFCYPDGDITLQLENAPLYYNVFPENYSLTLFSGDSFDSINFAILPIPGMEDLSIDVFHVLPDRPGFENVFYLEYSNLGTECIDNVVVEFTSDSLVSIVSVYGEGVITIGENSFVVELGTLCPFQNGTFEVVVQVDQSVNIGDELTYLALISPTDNDQNILDNNDTDLSVVVGSFDPNDKSVDYEKISPLYVENHGVLEYIIRFQNTGNYYAENVVIRDPLDSDLISATLKIKDASHPMTVAIIGDELVFEFNDIILPSSENDEEGSHGFVRFTMEPRPDFSFEDIIENTGFIYFDYNEPIVTNTVSTLLEDTDINVDELEGLSDRIYPNPSNGTFYITSNNLEDVFLFRLYDLLGNVVSSGKIRGNVIKIDDVTEGVYFIKTFNRLDKQLNVIQVVIEK